MSLSSTSTYYNTTTISDVVITKGILSVIDHYIEVILYIIGVCGALLNIFTFLQPQLRSNPCSLYFLAGSLCDLCTCSILIMLNIMVAFQYQSYRSFSQTSFGCKLSNYWVFMFPCLSSLYITFASIDRFCTSARQMRLRKLSSVKVSRIVILCAFIVWGLFSLHLAIGYDIRKFTPTSVTATCTPAKDVYTFFVIIDGFFFALFNGAIVPFLITFFGILIIRHVRQTQHRRRIAVAPIIPISPVGTGNAAATTNENSIIVISRTNLQLIMMLLVQVCVIVVLNLPYVVLYLNNLYNTVTVTPFYLTISRIATWFWYLNYCKTFYINTLSSQLFRSILKRRIFYLLRRSRAQMIAIWVTPRVHHQT